MTDGPPAYVKVEKFSASQSLEQSFMSIFHAANDSERSCLPNYIAQAPKLIGVKGGRYTKFFPMVILICLYKEPKPRKPQVPSHHRPKTPSIVNPSPKKPIQFYTFSGS